jgi:hypothetical protein
MDIISEEAIGDFKLVDARIYPQSDAEQSISRLNNISDPI